MPKKKITTEEIVSIKPTEKSQISELHVTFTNEDMNKLVGKINELIEKVNIWE